MNYLKIKDRKAIIYFENTDSGNHRELLEEMSGLMAFNEIVFDFNKVEVTSNIIGLLMGLVKTLAPKGCSIIIRSLSEEGKIVLDKLGIQHLFSNSLIIE